MGGVAGFLAGLMLGVLFCVNAQNRLDDKHVENGLMEHRGVVYAIRKAHIAEATR